MAPMGFGADSVRGDGLFKLQTALLDLAKDRQVLGDARVRFDIPPYTYTSDRSGTTTRSQSPNPPTEEQQTHQQRRDRLYHEHNASLPHSQFSQQSFEEEKRAVKANSDGTRRIRVGENYQEIAHKNVKERWVAQGLWNDKWTQPFLGLWKHEEPLELESETEPDPDAPSPPLFGFDRKPRPRRLKSEDERRRIKERLSIRRREREASRPYHQFVYQMSEERERVQKESLGGEEIYSEDINTKVYKTVKSIWQERCIWNDEWGVIPGMTWKHEKNLQQALAELDVQFGIADREAPVPAPDKAPPTQHFSFVRPFPSNPRDTVYGSISPIDHLDDVEVSDTLDTDPQSCHPNADANLIFGNAQTSAFVPRSPEFRYHESRAVSLLKRTVRGASKQYFEELEEQLRSLPPSSQSPEFKASEPPAKKKLARQSRSNATQKSIQDASALPSHKDVATSRRRCKGTRGRKSKPISNERIKKDVPRRQRRIVSDNLQAKSSAKPQGVTKRRSSRILAAKARK